MKKEDYSSFPHAYSNTGVHTGASAKNETQYGDMYTLINTINPKNPRNKTVITYLFIIHSFN